ncbi:MAG: hypothetical protein JWM12_2256 [Ilumatobacteraceae bacterium]|nr:hypothetical protein [Ilumatobacteraceae bacterium]
MVALISLTSAGCGSSAPSQTGTGAGTGTSGAKNATDQDKAVKFAECMRRHGVPHFPDPDAKGDFVFGIDVSPAVWQKAVSACKDLQPPGALSSKRRPKQQTASLRFAQCIRENGVKDFPDPANGEPLVDTTHIPSSNSPGGMTVLNAAMQKCRPSLGLAAGGQG